MSTIELQVDDNNMRVLLKKLQNLVDEGLVKNISTLKTQDIDITSEQAIQRISKAVNDYKNNSEIFTKADKDFFKDTKDRLIQRHSNANN